MDQEIKTFKEWYNSLSPEGKEKFRDEFLLATGLKYPSFYSKLARSVFSKLEQKFILEYAKCPLKFSKNIK